MSFFLRYIRKTYRVEIDPSTFKKGEVKEVRVWSWKRMRNRKYLACVIDGKLQFYEVGEG